MTTTHSQNLMAAIVLLLGALSIAQTLAQDAKSKPAPAQTLITNARIFAEEGLAVGALGSAGGGPPGDERFGTLRTHGPEHDSRPLNPSGSGWVAEDLWVMTSQKERTDSTVSK
jgi:hypothetical protein